MLVFLGSCKVYRNVEHLKPSYSKEEKAGEFIPESLIRLVVGDMIQVKTKSGDIYYMNYNRLNGNKLMGTLWKLNGKKINPTKSAEISIAEIEELKVKKGSATATMAFTSIIILGVVLLITTIDFGLNIGG